MSIRTALLLAPSLAALSLTPLAAASELKSGSQYLNDARDYALSPLHWDRNDWEWAAGTAAGIVAAYSVDERVRAQFADTSGSQMGDPHSLRDAAPTLALTFGTLAVGMLHHDEPTERTGWDMVEAVVLGSSSAFVLKQAFGRARPDVTDDRSLFRHGGDSFPSGHTTAAFSAAQVFADSRPPGEWQWRAFAYSLAVATAYARVNDNMHWTSDVVAGAALGIATGRFVSGRREESHPSRVSMWVTPIEHGAFVSFSFVPR